MAKRHCPLGEWFTPWQLQGEPTPDLTRPLPLSPSTESPPVKEEDQPDPCLTFYEESPPCETPPPEQKWETQSTASEDCQEDASPEDADSILDYALQLVYGIDIHDTSVSPLESRRVVQEFIRELGQTLWHAAPDSQHTSTAMSGSTSNSSTPGNSGTGEPQRGGKRKKQGGNGGGGSGRGGDNDGDEFTDGDGEGYLPVKRPKPNPKDDDNLRLSCPFRKRNPQRFNVRDHHSCAMTFFPKFAELRQHIVKQHKRDDPSAFVCGRCNRDFTTRRELHHHQRLPREQMCEISDHDPESGIDGSTSTKLLSRKRASGTSADVQWREIWSIIFPEDDDYLIPLYRELSRVMLVIKLADKMQTSRPSSSTLSSPTPTLPPSTSSAHPSATRCPTRPPSRPSPPSSTSALSRLWSAASPTRRACPTPTEATSAASTSPPQPPQPSPAKPRTSFPDQTLAWSLRMMDLTRAGASWVHPSLKTRASGQLVVLTSVAISHLRGTLHQRDRPLCLTGLLVCLPRRPQRL